MPIDSSNKFWVRGSFQSRTISRMSRTSYTRAHNSSCLQPHPYPSPQSIMTCVNYVDDERWYQDEGQDLHLSNFVFLARMQTARRLSQHVERFPECDPVLGRLMAEGTFDHQDPNVPHSSEEFAMNHATAMIQRVLMRVEALEAEVCVVTVRMFGGCTDTLLVDGLG